MNRDRDYPECEIENIDDYMNVPNPIIEAGISEAGDEFGALSERILEDIEEAGLTVEDAIEVWEMGLNNFISMRYYLIEEDENSLA